MELSPITLDIGQGSAQTPCERSVSSFRMFRPQKVTRASSLWPTALQGGFCPPLCLDGWPAGSHLSELPLCPLSWLPGARSHRLYTLMLYFLVLLVCIFFCSGVCNIIHLNMNWKPITYGILSIRKALPFLPVWKMRNMIKRLETIEAWECHLNLISWHQ